MHGASVRCVYRATSEWVAGDDGAFRRNSFRSATCSFSKLLALSRLLSVRAQGVDPLPSQSFPSATDRRPVFLAVTTCQTPFWRRAPPHRAQYRHGGAQATSAKGRNCAAAPRHRRAQHLRTTGSRSTCFRPTYSSARSCFRSRAFRTRAFDTLSQGCGPGKARLCGPRHGPWDVASWRRPMRSWDRADKCR